MLELYDQIQEATKAIQARWPGRPRVGIILGTGLGGLAEEIQAEASIPYEEVPHFPRPTVVSHTGRLVCVDEATPRCSIAADVSAQVAQVAFSSLRAGIEMVTAPHTPVPFSPVLEDAYIPSAAKVASAVRRTLGKE